MIFFEAEVFDWKFGDIAIDDIEFYPGSCLCKHFLIKLCSTQIKNKNLRFPKLIKESNKTIGQTGPNGPHVTLFK